MSTEAQDEAAEIAAKVIAQHICDCLDDEDMNYWLPNVLDWVAPFLHSAREEGRREQKLAGQPSEGTWRTMESAPKDGTQIWAWDEERGSNPAIWIGDRWVITYDDAEIQPTHWQSLPSPPTGRFGAAKEMPQ